MNTNATEHALKHATAGSSVLATQRVASWKNPKRYIILVILAAAGFAIWKLPVAAWFLEMVGWIQGQGVVGYAVYVAVYTLGAVLFFPGSVLTFGAGFAWGVVLGTILVSVASMTGASAAFLIGRYLTHDWVEGKVAGNERFQRIYYAVANRGFKIVILTRLSPLFPFSLQNYAYGLTGVSFRDYFVASWIGMLPGTIMYVYIGSLFTELAQLASKNRPDVSGSKIFYIIGLVITVVVTVYITRIARKALQEETTSASV
ncbi:TVP38/TMEM64 family protein [candidate division KSB1 bacterium]|nr:TVP38/TMEM64 family protein [candidate division KSB1 bacterium]